MELLLKNTALWATPCKRLSKLLSKGEQLELNRMGLTSHTSYNSPLIIEPKMKNYPFLFDTIDVLFYKNP